MAKTRRKWFAVVRDKFLRSSLRSRETIIVLHTNNTSSLPFPEETPQPLPPPQTTTTIDFAGFHAPPSTASIQKYDHGQDLDSGRCMEEIVAATIIQTCFRRRLAQRAYKALKSLVKLQAMVRGASVRRQARLALQCMQALARLQVTIRAHQLLLLPP